MKKSALLMLALLAFVSCSQAPKARFEGHAENLSDTTLLLQKVIANQLTTIDTVKVDAVGAFHGKVAVKKGAPVFCHLSDGEATLASLVLLPGDRVRIQLKADGDYAVEGSEESLLMKQINDEFRLAGYKMSVCADALEVAADEKTAKELRTDIGRAYVDYKRFALAHVMSHPKSITSAALFFQKFGNNLPVFGELTDVLVIKQVYDSIQPVYPNSEYVLALPEEIRSRETLLEFNNKLDAVEAVSYPDLTMPDIEGQPRKLSDLAGQVIIVSFWSVVLDGPKMFNHTLADLYAKYHARGLEIYQISLDVDKAVWATVVSSQEIPWISVNDGNGRDSRSVSSYNVTQLPTLYVIDRKGDIVGKDLFDATALEALIRRSL